MAMSAMTHDMTMDFEAALARHRRELHVHCYRMLGSFDEAEDAIQEAFLRAWRARHGFEAEGPPEREAENGTEESAHQRDGPLHERIRGGGGNEAAKNESGAAHASVHRLRTSRAGLPL